MGKNRKVSKKKTFVENKKGEGIQKKEKITRLHSLLEAVKYSPRRVNKILIQEGSKRPQLTEIIGWAKKNRIPFFYLPPKKMRSIDPNHQGAIALMAAREYSSVDDILAASETPFLLILDGIEDPQNLGAIIRTAEGAGADGILIPDRRAALLTESVAQVASGALEHVKVARVKNISRTMEELRRRKIWLVGAEGDGEGLWYEFDYSDPIGLVFGSEGKGLKRLTREKCDRILSIPLSGAVSSLNVAAAAAIFMYEVVRQRKSVIR